jgi:hypothetical protein
VAESDEGESGEGDKSDDEEPAAPPPPPPKPPQAPPPPGPQYCIKTEGMPQRADVAFTTVEIANLQLDGSRGETNVKILGKYYAVASRQRYQVTKFKKSGEGAEFKEPDLSSRLLIYAGELDEKFKTFLVETSLAEIKKCIGEFKADTAYAKAAFIGTHKAIFKYTTKSLDVEYEKQSEAWENWCADIMLYFCARSALFKSPVPLTTPPPVPPQAPPRDESDNEGDEADEVPPSLSPLFSLSFFRWLRATRPPDNLIYLNLINTISQI